jgi:hypothetical protein
MIFSVLRWARARVEMIWGAKPAINAAEADAVKRRRETAVGFLVEK